jgi:glycosyltransferase involved in cell wall biosynthesis
MKLCHVVPSLEERHGGPSKSVRAISAGLAEIGHDVELFATAPDGTGGKSVDGRLTTTILRRDWPQRLCPSAGLRAALESSNAQIVHHHSLWLRTLHYAHERTRRGDARLVISPRGMMSEWAWQHHGWQKRIAQKFIHPGAMEEAAGWHATSDEEADEIRRLGFRQPICVAPNGVEAPAPEKLTEAREHWHQLCPETAERPVALFYSRFHSKKRVLELIDLWLEHGPADWLLLLVGIPQEFSLQELERYVLRMSAQGRVRAFSGIGQPAPYAVASLFVLPSHNENFGLVIAEAMANGVPVVVTDTTPWKEVGRREIGWCVSWPQFAVALRQATAESSDSLARRGERAREWVLREFSWQGSARQLGEFYADLVNTPL